MNETLIIKRQNKYGYFYFETSCVCLIFLKGAIPLCMVNYLLC